MAVQFGQKNSKKNIFSTSLMLQMRGSFSNKLIQLCTVDVSKGQIVPSFRCKFGTPAKSTSRAQVVQSCLNNIRNLDIPYPYRQARSNNLQKTNSRLLACDSKKNFKNYLPSNLTQSTSQSAKVLASVSKWPKIPGQPAQVKLP